MNLRGNVTERGESNGSTSSTIPQSACGRAPNSMEEKREDYSNVVQHPRYDHAGPSCELVHAKPPPTNAEGSDSATENTNVTAPRYWQSINDGSFGKGYQQSVSMTERAKFYEISNVYERDHWTTAPFAPRKYEFHIRVKSDYGPTSSRPRRSCVACF
jgi:hypothetical protein